jgi:drug/metabolite transporter (DMT)-like permease
MVAIVLSLASAFLFACAATAQQHATRVVGATKHSERQPSSPLTAEFGIVPLIRDLLRSRLWLLGWCLNLVGFLTQAAALHLGSVALVQPLLVTQLLFTLPLVSIWDKRWPLPRDWTAGLLICAGVAVFLSVRDATRDAGSADRARILIACMAALVVIGCLVVASAGRSATVHASEVAIAAGLCFALSAVLTKLTASDLLHRGVAATAADWPGYALAASTLLGLLLEQEAFSAGPLSLSIAAMTITNPIASYLIGVLAFDVKAPTSPSALAALAVSGGLLFVGAAVLSGSPTVRRENAGSPVRAGQLGPGVR